MKKLIIELVEKDVLVKTESQILHTERMDEFLDALVLMCNKLGVDVPIWTHKEERMLLKKNVVIISNDDSITQLKIMTKDR